MALISPIRIPFLNQGVAILATLAISVFKEIYTRHVAGKTKQLFEPRALCLATSHIVWKGILTSRFGHGSNAFWLDHRPTNAV